MIRAGLLICDRVRPELLPIQGTYFEMFQKLLPEMDLVPYYVCDGKFPQSVNEEDIYITTGSSFSVYDDIPWIIELRDFVTKIHKAKKYFIGICFGHQMMAHALGGLVDKSDAGWCIGVHQSEILKQELWMNPFKKRINLLMMCQDQVIQLPPGGKVIAKTDLCPVSMFTIGSTFLGIQAHPEYSKLFDQGLYNIRRELIGDKTLNQADKTLPKTLNNELVATWIMNFVQRVNLSHL